MNEKANRAINSKRSPCVRASRLVTALTTLVLMASAPAAEFLEEFVEVTTRAHVDTELGFRLDYPYKWNPSSGAIPDADFYVGEPYGAPSFTLIIEDRPDAVAVQDSLDDVDMSVFPNHAPAELTKIDFNGYDAVSLVVSWTTEGAGRHFLETKIVSFYAGENWYRLILTQSYRDTVWRPRLDALLASFTLLDEEES